MTIMYPDMHYNALMPRFHSITPSTITIGGNIAIKHSQTIRLKASRVLKINTRQI